MYEVCLRVFPSKATPNLLPQPSLHAGVDGGFLTLFVIGGWDTTRRAVPSSSDPYLLASSTAGRRLSRCHVFAGEHVTFSPDIIT